MNYDRNLRSGAKIFTSGTCWVRDGAYEIVLNAAGSKEADFIIFPSRNVRPYFILKYCLVKRTTGRASKKSETYPYFQKLLLLLFNILLWGLRSPFSACDKNRQLTFIIPGVVSSFCAIPNEKISDRISGVNLPGSGAGRRVHQIDL